MSRRTHDDLVHELARDLRPVRPIASLRVTAVKLLALWLGAVGVSGVLRGGLPSLGADTSSGQLLHWSILVGLAILAGGALLAACASVVPGRDRVARASRAVAALGVAWVVGFGLAGIIGDQAAPHAELLAGSFACFGYAIVLGLPSLGMAAAFLSRGVAANPRLASGVAAAGTVGLGAFAVHATCPDTGGYHVLLSHCLTPILAAGLLALPLAALIVRASRTESRSLPANP